MGAFLFQDLSPELFENLDQALSTMVHVVIEKFRMNSRTLESRVDDWTALEEIFFVSFSILIDLIIIQVRLSDLVLFLLQRINFENGRPLSRSECNT